MGAISNVRVAIRTLARRPLISLVAIISLAVGIGVNSAVFSIVDALFLRPPAVQDPYSLVGVNAQFRDSATGIMDWSDCQDVAAQVPAFSGTASFMERGGMWRTGDETVLLSVTVVSDNYFELLGVKPVMGRFPAANGQRADDPEPPLFLTHWFWKEKMGARPDIVGQTMQMTGHLFRVAAVLPPEFRGLRPTIPRHVWMPVGSWTRHARSDLERNNGQFELLARLGPGATMDQAQAQLDGLSRRIEQSDSRVPKGRRLVAESLGQQIRTRVLPGVIVMLVVSLVLLVACLNVATALLAAADARRREIGVRLALGAGQGALLRQFLTESAILAVAGAAVGLLLARWLLSLAPVLAPPSEVPLSFDLRMDTRLLLFTGSATLVTLVIFSLAPFVHSLRVSLLDALAGARTAGRVRTSISRNAFVAVQVALSIVLVSGAIALVRTLADARQIYTGVDSSRPLALVWANRMNSITPEDVVFGAAADRMASVAGVEGVTYARHLPLVDSGSGASVSVVPQGAAADAVPPRVYFNLVGPRFFEVTGARITRGRPFRNSDHHGGAPVAILNTEAARRFWPGEEPIGKTLRAGKASYEVVGITADAPIAAVHGSIAPAVLLPASRMEWGETIFIVSTKVDPSSVLKDLARAAGATPDLRVYQSMTLRTLNQQALYGDWMPAVLGGALAFVGLLLAAGGLYGAISYATQRRMNEFGVRVAIGARAGQISALVLRQAAALCCAGLPFGVGLFVAVYHYYGPALLRNRPMDLFALGLGAAVTVAVVLTGALLPALRAARLDPVEVLRSE